MSDKPYRPSNGTAGAAFCERWCCACARDAVMNGTMDFEEAERTGRLCSIIADTNAYSPGDAEYPKDWVLRDGVPTCTAYTEHVRTGDLSAEERKAQSALGFAEAGR